MQIQDYFRATQSRYPSRKYQPFGNIMDVNEVVVAAEVISSEDNECFECEEYQRNEMGNGTALAVCLRLKILWRVTPSKFETPSGSPS